MVNTSIHICSKEKWIIRHRVLYFESYMSTNLRGKKRNYVILTKFPADKRERRSKQKQYLKHSLEINSDGKSALWIFYQYPNC